VHPLERHPDDLPPDDLGHRARRSIPRGVGWAFALAAVTFSILLYVADGSDGDDVTRLGSTDPVTGRAAAESPGPGPDGASVGSQLPDLAFTRFDGAEASLGDYAGTPLVINFWASFCVPCITEMPEFESVHQDLGDQVAFLGINVTEGPDPARRMIDSTGITYDVGRDPKGDVIRALGGINLPTTVIVAADGRIAHVSGKQLSAAELRDKLAAVLP